MHLLLVLHVTIGMEWVEKGTVLERFCLDVCNTRIVPLLLSWKECVYLKEVTSNLWQYNQKAFDTTWLVVFKIFVFYINNSKILKITVPCPGLLLFGPKRVNSSTSESYEDQYLGTHKIEMKDWSLSAHK